MAIDYIDGLNRHIYLGISTMNTEIHPIDIYKEMRTLRASDANLRKYDLFMSAGGNITKTATTATERYVTLLNGSKIIPYDSSHVITVIGTIITDSGQSGVDCFDRSSLSPTTVVDINYIPPQVEIITVATGAGPTVSEIRTEMEKAGTKLTVVKEQTDKMIFTGDDIKATLDGEEVVTDMASRNASKATGFASSNDMAWLLKIVKNKKILEKNGAVWELILYDDNNVTPICRKVLKDKDGNDITDLEAGALAMELTSSV